jgi:hypothetical protein
MVEQALGQKLKNHIIMAELLGGRITSSVHGTEDDLTLLIHMHM